MSPALHSAWCSSSPFPKCRSLEPIYTPPTEVFTHLRRSLVEGDTETKTQLLSGVGATIQSCGLVPVLAVVGTPNVRLRTENQ
jgi:hypothetical protein